ncbi:MAG: polysaccharide deacetylase family protein [Dehalococcoidia bacterium]|nr:polysaccharide deacetylase family protein [Dehalococcoidia bacterium]
MSGVWPGETQCVVMLGFDVDGPSAMIRRNAEVERMPSARSMGEFGPRVAVPRILELLHEYDVPASFYVPGWVAERWPEAVTSIAAAGHEVGHHGYLHEAPASLSRETEAEVLDRGSAILQAITGQPPEGYRSPSWELSEHSLALLAERGFLYDSSLMGDDAPYAVSASEDGAVLVEVPVHWSLDDAPAFAFNPAVGRLDPMSTPEDMYVTWLGAFEELYARGRAFTLTMHPWVIGRAGRLRMLERLIRTIRGYPRVEWARTVDVARDFAVREGLPVPQRR